MPAPEPPPEPPAAAAAAAARGESSLSERRSCNAGVLSIAAAVEADSESGERGGTSGTERNERG